MSERHRHSTVRLARYADMEGILETLLKALASTDTPFPEPEQPYAQQYNLDKIAQQLVFVAENEAGRIVGCIILSYAHWPWTRPSSESGKHLLNEHFWVEPEYRRGGTASRLIKAAQDRADAVKLPLLLEISSEDANSDLKDRFVRHQGFKYLGGKFYRPARGG